MAISLEFFITHRSPDEANREETVASETKATIDQNFALSGKLTAETNTYRVNMFNNGI